jgi:hypothetical protein
LQYFLGAVEIFFGSESIAAFEMRRLILQMGGKDFNVGKMFASCHCPVNDLNQG